LSAAAASTGVASGSGGAAVTVGVADGFGVETGVGRGVGRAVATVAGEAAAWLGGWLTAAVPEPLHAAIRTAIGRRDSAAFRGEEMVDRTIGDSIGQMTVERRESP
jgi:hypothetical protein